jgi:hypothetical protein
MTVALPAEVRELLGVVLAAIDIPYPATLGDTERYQEVLAERGDAHRYHPSPCAGP